MIKKSNSHFFEYYFKRNRQIHNFWAYSQGLTEDRLRLYFDDFKKLSKLALQLKKNNQKSPLFFPLWMKRLANSRKTCVVPSQYKQGMMQKLFSQQIRFKADDGSEFGEWEEVALSEIAVITMAVEVENYNETLNGSAIAAR